jgi:regulator of protease activity HflC (stomatin/prohibitin superfamily)
MAKIKIVPFLRHVRSDSSRHVIQFKRGVARRSGRGLAFWFLPLSSSVMEIPIDDREVPFLFHARSGDFQDVTTQGAITYRVTDPEALAGRVDFTIDNWRGEYVERPLERLADVFLQLAQRIGAEYVSTTPVRRALAEGQREIRRRLEAAMTADEGLAAMGLAVVSVNVTSVAPSAELEKAIQAPTREEIQQRSDEARFQRRALAVEKERAIRENELQNRIELAKREEDLIGQEGQNERRRATETAEAEAILVRAKTENDRLEAATDADVSRLTATAAAEAARLHSAAEAEGIESVEGARVEAERGRIDIYRELPPHVLLGLAAREFAGKLQKIERIQLTPDGVGPLLSDLADAGARLLDSRSAAAALEREDA